MFANKKQDKKLNFSTLPQYAGTIDYLRKHPGGQAADVAKATGAGIHATRKRLMRLQAEGVITADRYPRALLFYVKEE